MRACWLSVWLTKESTAQLFVTNTEGAKEKGKKGRRATVLSLELFTAKGKALLGFARSKGFTIAPSHKQQQQPEEEDHVANGQQCQTIAR